MKTFLKFILGLVLIVAIAAIGVFVYFKLVYDTNLITAFNQVKQVLTPTDTQKVVDNAFLDADMASAKESVNSSISNLITYSQEEGYSINSSPSGMMSGDIILTDKECGAILNLLMQKSSSNVSIKIDNIELNFELVQVKFSNLLENSVDFNTVVKIDITELKETYNSFPINLVVQKLPNQIYISSTITLTKTTTTPFEFTKQSKELSINNLNATDTNDFLKLVNNFVKIGTSEEFNILISGGFADALTGKQDVEGFAKSLNVVGATDCSFVKVGETIKFKIKK